MSPLFFTEMVGVFVSISVSCGVESGSLSSIPCTIAVVVIIKITSSTQAKSSNGVILMSDTAPCDFREKRLIDPALSVQLRHRTVQLPDDARRDDSPPDPPWPLLPRSCLGGTPS